MDKDFCKACDNIKEIDPSLIVNGLTDDECASLKNDTGLVPENEHNNCADLDTLNDCLIGNITGAIEPLEVCDWKPFTKHLLVNLWTVLKAFNCSMCGIWTNIHLLWDEVDKLWADIARIWANITSLWEHMGAAETAIVRIDANIDEIEADIDGIHDDISGIRNDITGIRGDITDIRGDITTINSDIGTINSNITTINNNITSINNNITDIRTHLNKVSYVGLLKLYTTTQKIGDGSTEQRLAFNANSRQGNINANVLTVKSDYKGIVVNNTTNVPLLVDSTFNCSIRTEQHIACCYIDVERNGKQIGQTPFITPSTYDQQCMGESFILSPGQSATLTYVFRIGGDNNWYQSKFGYKNDGSGEPNCCLEVNVPGDERNQESYFLVKVTSVVAQL